MVFWSVEPNDAVGHRRLSIPVDNVEWEPWIIYGHHVLTPPWSGRAILTSEDVSTGSAMLMSSSTPTREHPSRARRQLLPCLRRLAERAWTGSCRGATHAGRRWWAWTQQTPAPVRLVQASVSGGEPANCLRRWCMCALRILVKWLNYP
jgi:hypothetical protein